MNNIIETILAGQALLRRYEATPREVHLTRTTYERLKKEVNDRALFVSVDQAKQAALHLDAFQGMRIVIDDRLADGEAHFK